MKRSECGTDVAVLGVPSCRAFPYCCSCCSPISNYSGNQNTSLKDFHLQNTVWWIKAMSIHAYIIHSSEVFESSVKARIYMKVPISQKTTDICIFRYEGTIFKSRMARLVLTALCFVFHKMSS